MIKKLINFIKSAYSNMPHKKTLKWLSSIILVKISRCPEGFDIVLLLTREEALDFPNYFNSNCSGYLYCYDIDEELGLYSFSWAPTLSELQLREQKRFQ